MDAFVFPSETDTFGNVVLEAMASGVPPIVAAGGGPKYLVQSGVNGFQAANPHEIVFAILKLQYDPAWRRELAANARQAVMQFSVLGLRWRLPAVRAGRCGKPIFAL